MLLALAAPAEAEAALRALSGSVPLRGREWEVHRLAAPFDVLVTGVGKASSAGAVARFADPSEHRGILSLGVAGSLPGSGLGLGAVVAASSSVFADEGLATADGFRSCPEMGFPLGPFEGNAVPPDPRLFACLRALAGVTGPVATVSTCSGTDALAEGVRERTGALAEAMEGAAVGAVAARLGIPFAEVRVISNTAGERAGQSWDLSGALAVLSGLIGRL